MANSQLGTRVWKLDTASASVIFQSQIWIKFVEWFNPANGDTMELQDRNGNTIIAGVAIVAGDTQTFNLENVYEGLKMPTLTSSYVLVHIK